MSTGAFNLRKVEAATRRRDVIGGPRSRGIRSSAVGAVPTKPLAPLPGSMDRATCRLPVHPLHGGLRCGFRDRGAPLE